MYYCALRELGLEQDNSVSVQVAHGAWTSERTYTVVIAYQAARVALARLLRRSTSTSDKYAVGVWVLDESEARFAGAPRRPPSSSSDWREAPALGIEETPIAGDALLQWVRVHR